MEYAISENKSLIDLDLLNKLYPVGTVYTTVSEVNPNTVFGGTWVKIASGRCLMGADSSHGVGTTANAGLPNITGFFRVDPDQGWCRITTDSTGAFYASGSEYRSTGGSTGSNKFTNTGNFDASRCSSIYGNSSTVQPPALFVYFWQRTG